MTARKLLVAVFAVFALVAGSGVARADNKTEKADFRLTVGDFQDGGFVVAAPGQVQLSAEWRSAGVVRKDTALRLKLIRPNGTVAKEVTGGSPIVLNYTISAAEAAQFKGQQFKVKLSNDVAQPDRDTVTGSLTASFPIATQTLFNNSNAPRDLAPKGAKTAVNFTIPNQPGRVVIDITFRDGLANLKDLVAQLSRPDNIIESTDGGKGLRITHTFSANELALGRNLTLTLANNANLLTVRGIVVVVKYTAN